MTQSPISALLKHKDNIYHDIKNRRGRVSIFIWFTLLSLVGLAFFGAVMSTAVGTWGHAMTLTWKTIAVVWGPIIICTPSLYVFGSISGSRLTLLQLVLLLSGALATSGMVLIALTPLTWFFTWTADAPEFIRAMNAIFIGLSLAFGMLFFSKGVRYLSQTEEEAKQPPRLRIDVVALWYVLLIIVVVQMSDKLGPWYEERTVPVEYHMGDINFPRNPVGDFTILPHIEPGPDGTNQLAWRLPAECQSSEVEMVEEGFTTWNGKLWQGFSGTCEMSDTGWNCTANMSLEDYRYTTWRTQAHARGCVGSPNGGEVYSQPVTLTY